MEKPTLHRAPISADQKVIVSGATIVSAALLMVVVQVLGQSHAGARMVAELFWAEVLLGTVIFIVTVIEGD